MHSLWGYQIFVSSFTEGIDMEMKRNKHLLRAKVLAPAATETEFEQTAHQSNKSKLLRKIFTFSYGKTNG